MIPVRQSGESSRAKWLGGPIACLPSMCSINYYVYFKKKPIKTALKSGFISNQLCLVIIAGDFCVCVILVVCKIVVWLPAEHIWSSWKDCLRPSGNTVLSGPWGLEDPQSHHQVVQQSKCGRLSPVSAPRPPLTPIQTASSKQIHYWLGHRGSPRNH